MKITEDVEIVDLSLDELRDGTWLITLDLAPSPNPMKRYYCFTQKLDLNVGERQYLDGLKHLVFEKWKPKFGA